MDRPDGSHGERRPEFRQQQPAQQIDQGDVGRVEREIDDMIANGRRAISEDGVVEQVRKRGQGAIQRTDGGFVPVVFGENQAGIFGGGLVDARVADNYGVIVVNQAGAEGVGIRRERQSPEHQ